MVAAEDAGDEIATILVAHEGAGGDLAELLAKAISKAMSTLREQRAG